MLRHELGRDVTFTDLVSEPLAQIEIVLKAPEMVQQIAETIDLSLVPSVWGVEAALAARYLAVEIGQNALTHGAASKFQVSIKAHSIVLHDDGEKFTLGDLATATGARGGARALQDIRRFNPNLVVSYVRHESMNITTIATTNALKEMLVDHPCTVNFYGAPQAVTAAMEFVKVHSECETVFLKPTYGGVCYSDLYSLAQALKLHEINGRDIALVLPFHSHAMKELCREIIPSIRIIET
ncbi:hypothetical protein [Asticcacaulis taihuensis]|uniref:hypothetical protein n=1 Tax=Asticcacaulis taihuensis TaxID=260084 RepID=UPI0026ED181A|nr:hypothetical protein [Asticcacaulis taihuensis]